MVSVTQNCCSTALCATALCATALSGCAIRVLAMGDSTLNRNDPGTAHQTRLEPRFRCYSTGSLKGSSVGEPLSKAGLQIPCEQSGWPLTRCGYALSTPGRRMPTIAPSQGQLYRILYTRFLLITANQAGSPASGAGTGPWHPMPGAC